MPKLKRLRRGVGAKISVLKKFLHPRPLVDAKYPNAGKTDMLHDLVAVGQEEKTVSKKPQSCIIMRHNDFDDGQLLHAVARHCKVVQEGAPEHIFNDTLQDSHETNEAVAMDGQANEVAEIPTNLIGGEVASNFRALGFCVDDDNDPAPENIPSPSSDNSDERCIYMEWNSVPLDTERLCGALDMKPSLIQADRTLHTILGYFTHFLPVSYFKNTVLPATKCTPPLTWEEFLRFLALIFIMATTQGNARRDFWSSDTPDMFAGAPFRLHSFMSRRRFEDILKHLKFTREPPPSFRHPFHEINDLIRAFNEHTQSSFSPGWVSCLDESMSVWTNQYTCPGWMFVPRKPHPMGNEYHSVCCGLSGIMYSIELVEGNDRPKEIPPPKYHEKGITSGLLLRLTESIAHSGRVVIMDSGFCVIDAILNLASVGIFSSAVIKKRRYWPKYIDGEAVDQYFVGKTVGSVEALPGSVGGKAFRLFAMKEEDYVVKLMTTYGSCIEINDGWTQRSILENGRRVTKKFKYYEPFYNHLKFRHKVDDHNNLRHSPISLEASLSTKDWKIRVFTFILALVEVNARLAYAYFSGSELLNQIEFRRKLAKELLDYSYQVRGQRRVHEGLCASTCGEETAPRFAGQWTGTEWTQLATMYPQHVCKTYNCTRRIRTYCRCKIGYWLCPTCIGIHIASKENYNGVDD